MTSESCLHDDEVFFRVNCEKIVLLKFTTYILCSTIIFIYNAEYTNI